MPIGLIPAVKKRQSTKVFYANRIGVGLYISSLAKLSLAGIVQSPNLEILPMSISPVKDRIRTRWTEAESDCDCVLY